MAIIQLLQPACCFPQSFKINAVLVINQIDFNNESGYPSVSVIKRVDIDKPLIKLGCNSHRISRMQDEC
jgi:hypothetical protein